MSDDLVLFTLDGQEFGLCLPLVERVVRAVEITPLPDAPEGVLGLVNVQGTIVPVLNPRSRFRLPVREMQINDHLIIAHIAGRTVGLLVDAVIGVLKENQAMTLPAGNILQGLAHVEGVVKMRDGLVLIHDLNKFLSVDDEKSLHAALNASR